MAVQDLWYKTVEGKKVPSVRHGRGRRWRVVNEGAPTESFDLKTEAVQRDLKIRSDLATNTFIDPRRGKVQVEQYSTDWLSHQLHGPGTQEIAERTFRLYVNPNIGHMNIGAIKLSTLQTTVKKLNDVLKPRTVLLVWQYVSAMLRFAADNGDIAPLPLRRIVLPSVGPQKFHIPTQAQLEVLFEDSKGPVFKVGAGCGLRGGEIFGLEPAALDFKRMKISVHQQIRKVGREAPFIAPLKTWSSYREVDMPQMVAEAFKDHPTYLHMLWDRTDTQKPVQRSVELFWETPQTHQPYSDGTWSKMITLACKHGKIPHFKLHDLRHYYATLLIAKGATVKEVQRALGHAKASMTLDTYADFWPDHEDALGAMVDQAWSK